MCLSVALSMSRLSWDYKTNSPCSFGKKIINNLVTHSRWGFSLNWGWRRIN
jgi:hypothetical protein